MIAVRTLIDYDPELYDRLETLEREPADWGFDPFDPLAPPTWEELIEL